MPTILTRTIGSGKDYATFTAAEAAVATIGTSADLVANDEAIVFEADAGTYSAVLEFQSTITADATRNVTYKPASGNEHGGVVGAGVVLQGTNPAMTVRDAWIVFDGLEINITESGNRQVVSLRGEGMRGTVYRNCILWGGSLTDTVTERIWANTGADTYTLSAGEEVILENNKIWCSRRTIQLVGGTGQDARFKVLNNTHMGRGTNDVDTPALLRTAGVVDGTWVIDVYNNLVKDDFSSLTSTGDAVTVNASDNVAAAAGSSPTSALAGSQTWTFNTDTTASSTGSQAIWDASTGELVNASGNDAVGVGDASGAPTTDINGEDRIRDTHVDPGAFTTDLLTLTKSIDGGGGGDYTTFTAAEAATTAIGRSADLIKENTAIVFEAEAGTYSETFIIDSQSASLVTDATRNVTYTYASGAYHGGSSGAGVKISETASVIKVKDPHTVLDGLEVVGTATNTGSVIWVEGYGYNGSQYRNLIVWSGVSLSDSTGGNFASIRQNNPIASYTPTTPMVIENTVFNSTNFGITVRSSASDNGFDVVIRNCTTTDSVRFLTDGGDASVPTGGASKSVALHNNLDNSTGGLLVGANTGVTGTATNVFNDSTLPSAQRAGSQLWQFNTDTTASSTGSQAIWDASTGELVNASGNDAIGVGDASSAPTTDIQGLDRIRDTHVDPGAFTTDLLTLTKSIDGGGGGDYTTFIAAEAATTAIGRSADLVKENTAIVFEAEAGTYSGFLDIDSTLTTDPTRNVTYKAAAGSEHGGEKGTGVILSSSSNSGNVEVNDAYVCFEDVIFENLWDTASQNTNVILKTGSRGFKCTNVLFYGTATSGTQSPRFNLFFQAAEDQPNAADAFQFDNCVFRSSEQVLWFLPSSSANNTSRVSFRNCTSLSPLSADGTAYFMRYGGLVVATGQTYNVDLHNNNHAAGNKLFWDPSSDYNASHTTITASDNLTGSSDVLSGTDFAGSQLWTFTTDDTAASTGSQVIYDETTGEMYDVAGNDAWHYLTDLTNAPAIAIDGLTRDASGFNPGAFEESAVNPLPAQVTTGTPVSGSINVPLDQDLSWASATGASGYDVYFGVNTASSLVSADQVGLTYDPGTLLVDTTYAWRVDSKNAAGTTSGIELTFTTVPAPPSQITTGTPLSGATTVPLDQALLWDAATGASGYDVYFGTTTSPALVSADQAGLSYDPGTLTEGTTYYWAVNSKNAGGVTSGIEFSFTTAFLPDAVTTGTPVSGSVNVPLEQDLSWASATNASGYDVYFGTSTSPPLVSADQVGLTYDPGTLATDTTYYWIVNSKSLAGTTSGTELSFTTVPAPPSQVTTGTPASGAINVSLEQDVSWSSATGASGYDVYFGVGTPSSLVSADQVGLTYDPGTLAEDTTYAWRVDSKNVGGTTTGVEFTFTTLPPFPDQVTTGTPVSGSINVPLEQDLSWSTATGASGYDVYFGVGTPSSLVSADQVGLTYDPGTLAEDTTYAWRVDSKNVAGTTSGVEFTFTTLPPLPDAVTTGTPVSGAVDVPLDQDLSWASATNADTYDVYFGTSTSPSLAVSAQAGLSYDPGTLSPTTTYYWRVDTQNEAGVTTGTEFTFTTANLPGAVTTGTPVSGAINVSLDQDVSWSSATNADTYNVYFGTSTSPSLAVSAQAGLSYDPGTLAEDTTYYWRVDTQNAQGITTGTELTFTTLPPLPDAVTTGTPVSGAIDVPLEQDVLWDAATNADTYDVYFGTSTSPSLAVSAQAGLSYDPGTLTEGTTYYWRVDSESAAGVTTGVEFTFTTVNLPDAVTSGTPVSGAVDVPIEQDVLWDAATYADTYNVYFGTTPSPSLAVSAQAGLSYDPGTLSNETLYYWRVDSESAAGVTTGVEFTFTTVIPAPDQVGSPSPSNGAAGQLNTVNISWASATGATGYDVYFGTASGSLTQVADNQVGLTFNPGILDFQTEYFWRVDSVNVGGTTTGVVWSFTTLTPLPNAVTTGTPVSGAIDVRPSQTLSWPSATYADTYDVYFGTTPSPSLAVSAQAGLTYDPGGLSINTTYYWRVDSESAAGVTTGTSFSFTVGLPAPSDPSTEYTIVGDLSYNADAVSRSRRWDTREGDIRERVFKMTQSQHNISHVYKDSLRSMIVSFNDIITIDDEQKTKEVKIYHANAERAIAKLTQENSIVLPIISISQTVSEEDTERRRYESVLVHDKYWDAEEGRAKRIVSLAPTATNVNYQVNVWCKYMSDMDQIIEQIRLKFNPEMNVPTQRSTLAKAMLGSEEDVGSLVAQDKQDRILQKSFSVTLRTYVENPKFLLTSTGEIERFIIDTDS